MRRHSKAAVATLIICLVAVIAIGRAHAPLPDQPLQGPRAQLTHEPPGILIMPDVVHERPIVVPRYQPSVDEDRLRRRFDGYLTTIGLGDRLDELWGSEEAREHWAGIARRQDLAYLITSYQAREEARWLEFQSTRSLASELTPEQVVWINQNASDPDRFWGLFDAYETEVGVIVQNGDAPKMDSMDRPTAMGALILETLRFRAVSDAATYFETLRETP